MSYKDKYVTRGALSSEELQARLKRKAHRFTDRKKKNSKFACRGKIQY